MRQESGAHRVSTPIAQFADTMAYYARREAERRAPAEGAYESVPTRMTMGHSVRALRRYVDAARGNS